VAAAEEASRCHLTVHSKGFTLRLLELYDMGYGLWDKPEELASQRSSPRLKLMVP
jgi:hypothetical protein